METYPRPLLIFAAALAAVLVLGACGDKPRPGIPPRHLVLITVEGLRADHVTTYGYSRATTLVRKEGVQNPRDLDHVIDTGVCFANALSPTGRFLPTAVTLMTGRAPLEHGVLGEEVRLASSIPTLAERFAADGFATGAFLSSEQSVVDSGVERGFDKFEEALTTPKMLQGAIGWLKDRVNGGDPFFLWMHFGDIAPPFRGEALDDHFSEMNYAGPLGGEADFQKAWKAGEIEDNPSSRARLIDLYDGQVQRVGQFLDSFFWYFDSEFSEHQLWDRTLMVVAGTAGMELAERGAPNGVIGSEGSLVDAGLRVPLVLRHPQSLTGQRILAEVVDLADVTPTLADWFTLASDPGGAGRSLLALTDSYREREFQSRPALAIRIEDGVVTGRSLRNARWRVIFAEDRVELFDVESDPRSLRDVAGMYPEVVEELREWMEATPRPALR